jgi:hypothetical protein
VLECYGTGYADDVDTKNYKLRDKVSHRKQTIKNLKDIQKIYDISIRQLNDKQRCSISVERYSKVSSTILRD